MYNISNISQASKSFLQSIPINKALTQEMVSMGLARAISNDLLLPSNEVEGMPIDFYRDTAYSAVREAISAINEITVINVKRVEELAKTFWLVRYNVLYPRRKLFYSSKVSSESHFFGFSSLLSPVDSLYIQSNTEALIWVFNGFSDLLAELKTMQGDVVANPLASAPVNTFAPV